MIDEDELLGGSDWVERTPEPVAHPRPRGRRRGVLGVALLAVAVTAGLLAVVHPPPRSVARAIPPAAAPPLPRPVAHDVRRTPMLAVVHHADRRHRRMPKSGHTPTPRPAAPVATVRLTAAPQAPSPAAEFGFER